jgi:hypothetical protein
VTGLPAGLLARFDIQAVNCPSCSSPLTSTEFRFTGPPLSGLQGIDNFSQVIYAGTMSKILYPSLRLGYVVAPEQLIDSLVKIRSTMDQHSFAGGNYFLGNNTVRSPLRARLACPIALCPNRSSS